MWLLIILVVTGLYYYSWEKRQFFSSRGVKTLPPLPFLSNLAAASFGRENLLDVIDAGYNKFKDDRYFGVYQYLTPTLVPKDPLLIKQIMSNDFQAFPSRGVIIDPECDSLMGNSIIFIKGDKLRKVRDACTPAFSSAKCRNMTPGMVNCARVGMQYLNEIIDKQRLTDMTTVSTPYMNDVILSCAFGFASNSFRNQDTWIYKLGLNIVVQRLSQVMKLFGYQNIPTLMKLFRIKLVLSKDAEQFSTLLKVAIKSRKESGEYRSDFVQTLIEASDETLRKWPIVATPDRCSSTTFDFGPAQEGSKHSFIAPPGIIIWFPIYALHRDEKYWPEPDKFDPERFNSENKAKIVPYTYLPFRAGPRHCIGYRFALQAAKVFIFHFFREFQAKDPQSCEKISSRTFTLQPEQGFKMVVQKRVK